MNKSDPTHSLAIARFSSHQHSFCKTGHSHSFQKQNYTIKAFPRNLHVRISLNVPWFTGSLVHNKKALSNIKNKSLLQLCKLLKDYTLHMISPNPLLNVPLHMRKETASKGSEFIQSESRSVLSNSL